MLTLKKNEVLGRMHLRGYSNMEMFAEGLGISRQWLSALLNGKEQPSTDILLVMCEVLDCSIDDIVAYPKEDALVLSMTPASAAS